MSLMKDASIKIKVLASFAVALLCASFMGVFSLIEMTAVDDAAAKVRDDGMPSVGYIGRINADFMQYRIQEGAHVAANNDRERQDPEIQMKQAADDFAANVAAYAALVEPGYERDLFNKLKDLSGKYLALSGERILPLSRSNRDLEANAFVYGESLKIYQDVRKVLADLLLYNIEAGKKAGAAGAAAYENGRRAVIVAMIVMCVVCAAAGRLLVTNVSMPILAATDVMRRLARRELTVRVEGLDRKDEVGDMARAVQVFKEGLVEAARLSGEQMTEQAAKQRRTDAVDRLIRQFETAAVAGLGAVAAAASDLDVTAQGMFTMAQRAGVQATGVAGAAEETSVNVQTVAAAAEEMTASVREISTQVARSAQIAAQALGEASKTAEVVRNLAEAAQKIGEVVDLITDIAGQTNLLALNATIEAARAGEAGKGFAVVAQEVKNLAGQTARATEDIAAQIAAIQATTGNVVDAIGGFGGTVGRINETSTAVAAAIEEQSAAAAEISRNIQQASAGAREVSGNIGDVNRTAGETGAAAQQVLGAAAGLSRQAEALRGEVARFLTAIKAA